MEVIDIRALIVLGNERMEVEVKSYQDNGNSVKIVDTDSRVYITSFNNVLLMGDSNDDSNDDYSDNGSTRFADSNTFGSKWL